MLAALCPILCRLPRGTIIHYPLLYLPIVHRLLGHHLIVSWVAPVLPRFLWRLSRIRALAVLHQSLREARQIDVLNPLVRDKLARRKGLAPKLRITGGGTFVNLEHFRPAAKKRNLVVFLGRLEREKNALRFATAIPEAHRRLRDAGIDAEFHLYGKPEEDAAAIRAFFALRPDLPVKLGYADDPRSVLAGAKIFVSLQQSSNYPSKSLAEALACGCIPIITDTGESRLMAEEGFASFIPGDFTPELLGRTIAELLQLSPGELERRSAEARAFAERRFRIEVQVDYMVSLYLEARQISEAG